MTNRLSRIVLISVVVVGTAVSAYFLTFGHCFLPFKKSGYYPNEKLEMRGYSTFVVPSSSSAIPAALQRLTWRIVYPGRARLLAVANRLEAAAPNRDHTLQEVLETMGYDFPSGSGASSGDVIPGWRISHYPSMLKRIEKDLGLTMRYRVLLAEDESPSPNPQGGANGRQPFSSGTNSTPAAAASRRSP